jgi:hypothetical protein
MSAQNRENLALLKDILEISDIEKYSDALGLVSGRRI